MKSIQILTLISALWNVLPADSNPVRSLFDSLFEDPNGEIIATADPETDPVIINLPPPR